MAGTESYTAGAAAAVYTAQVSLGILVWNLRDARGRGWTGGVVAALIFLIPTIHRVVEVRSPIRAPPFTNTRTSGTIRGLDQSV
jgi:hypothetical protein